MRSLSAAQIALLNKPDRSEYLKVEIDSDGAGSFVNLCALGGLDFVRACSWGESADSPTADAEIVLQREDYYRSLAPLITDSVYSSYLALRREVKIYAAVMPEGVAAAAADYAFLFHGRIAKQGWGTKSPVLKLGCRDMSGDLADRFIEVQTNYGPASLESVIQSILDDHVNTSPGVPFTLATPVSPGFTVVAYQQQKQPVLEAIRTLSDLIGWELRMRFDSGSGTFKLTLSEPDRAATVPSFTFDQGTYYDLPKVDQNLDPIRNVVRVVYYNSGSGNARTSLEVEDATSIAVNGRRFMELSESATSQINTTGEATALANAALSDLKDPGVEHAMAARLFWPGAIGDYYRFSGNGIHYTADLDAGVVGLRHSLTNAKAGKTVIQTRGKPSAGVDRWLEKDARSGNAPAADLVAPAVAASLAVTQGMGVLVVAYDEPTEPTWALTELYLDDSAIAAPTYPTKPTASLLVASGRSNKLVAEGLTPGATYHGRLLIIDSYGAWLGSTAIVATATQQVGPYHENLAGQQDQLLRNNDLNVYTLGTALMPDRWAVATGTYASGGADDTVYVQTVDHRTGDKALDLFFGGTANSPEVEADYVPYQDADIIRAAIVARKDTAGGANSAPQVDLTIRFADKDKSTISDATVTIDLTTAYTRYITPVEAAPANTRFVKCIFSPVSAVDPTTDFTLQVDKASLIRGKGEASGLKAQTATTAFVIINYNVSGATGVSESSGTFTFSAPGQWRVRAALVMIDDAAPSAQFTGSQQLRVNGSQVALLVAASQTDPANDENCVIVTDVIVSVDEGDTLDVRMLQDQGATLGGVQGIELTQITREETS